MPSNQNIKLEAISEEGWPFVFYIEKAEATSENEELILEGIASTTNIDHDNERMAKDALRAMETIINKDGVPLRVEHQKDGAAIIGKVFKAWVDDRNQLHIQARLDKSHPVSSILHSSMKQGVKMGLSVGGLVKHAIREFSDSVGGMVKTFYDVALQEVSVTPRPSNYDSWLVAKSIAKNEKDAESYSNNISLRREFLFENSQLDYLQAFAKSVPDKAWRKVDSPIIKTNEEKNMTKEEMKNETEKSVSREEFNSLQKGLQSLSNLVAKGFDGLVKAMDTTPKNTTNPDKTKDEDPELQSAKAMDSDAKDQNNPDKKKPDDESATAKSVEETEDETKKAKEETYDLETVNRAIKSIDAMTKAIKKEAKEEETETKKAEDKKDEETTKAEDKEETTKTEDKKEEEMTTKSHPLDEFVAKTTLLMEAMIDKMEKGGKRVLGFEKSFIEDLRNSPEVQAEIKKLSKLPGFKKSVAMGVPYMATKDGRRIALINTPEKVEKSVDEKKDFKSVYKSDFSSLSQGEQGE